MNDFKKYYRKGFGEMRQIVFSESMENISVSEADRETMRVYPNIFTQGYICRNPNDHKDQWYVSKDWVDENYSETPFHETKKGWISVEDRLPAEGEICFIYHIPYTHGIMDIALYTHGGKREFQDENRNFPDCYNEEKGVSFLSAGFWLSSEADECLFKKINVYDWKPLSEAILKTLL